MLHKSSCWAISTFPLEFLVQFTALLWHKMSHVMSSCHWHMQGNPLLCHGWLSSPELHSVFCTIRTHTDYYCDSSWWVVSMLKACGWIWKISNTTSYSQTVHKQIPYIMVLEIFPPWASSLSVQDTTNTALYLNYECQALTAAVQPFSLAGAPYMVLFPKLVLRNAAKLLQQHQSRWTALPSLLL